MSNKKLITLNLAILILGLAIWKIATRWAVWEIGEKFVVIMIALIGISILTVMFILPTLGDFVGNLFYSAPEKAEPDAYTKAASKLAQGDYAGAIREYQSLARDEPNARFPIVEIAKIQLEKLENADLAIQTLETSLAQHDWPEDDAAFLMFRIAELHLDQMGNPARATEYLEGVIARFPNTRHSANATHRLHDIEKANLNL
jgi:outer membrane protein assembly factor BamD (BamD/ComL family)